MTDDDEAPDASADDLAYVFLRFHQWIAARATLSGPADHALFGLSLEAYADNRAGLVEWAPRSLAAWCKMDLPVFEEALAELMEGKRPKVIRQGDDLLLRGAAKAMRESHAKMEANRSRTAAAREALRRKREAERDSSDEQPDLPLSQTHSASVTELNPSERRRGEETRSAFGAYVAMAERAGLAIPSAATANRRKRLSEALSQVGGLDQWQRLVDRVGGSKALTGGAASGWRVTLDWLLTPANLTKVMEGNYDDRAGRRKGSALMGAIRKRAEEGNDD